MKKKLLKNILSLVVLIIVLFTTYEILKLNILPNKYLIPIIIGEIILYVLGLLLYNLKKKVFVLIGIILYLISIIGNIFGYYYLNKTNKYISKNLEYKTYKVTTKYYVLANKNDSTNDIKAINEEKKSNKKFRTFKYFYYTIYIFFIRISLDFNHIFISLYQ